MHDDLRIPVWLQGVISRAEAGSPVSQPLRAVLRDAFRAGDRAAPLALERQRVEDWSGLPGEPGLTSIVIPVRGAHEALRLCIACVRQHTMGAMYELVVVCPAAEEAAVREIVGVNGVVPTPDALCPTSEPLGFPAACNFGAQRAHGNRLVFLNSDAFVGPGWLDALLAPLAHGAVAVGPMGTNVSGVQCDAILGADEMPRTVDEVAAAVSRWASGQPPRPLLTALRLVGFCIAVDRRALNDVGGWFEGWDCPLGNFDDDDLCLRLTLLFGATACVVVPDLLVLHAGHASFAELPDADKQFREALTKNRKHFERRWGFLLPDWNAWMDKEGAR